MDDLEAVAAAKCLAQWLATGAPLAVLSPVIAVGLGASPDLMILTFFSALAAGLGFAFVGGMGAALGAFFGAPLGGALLHSRSRTAAASSITKRYCRRSSRRSPRSSSFDPSWGTSTSSFTSTTFSRCC